MRLEIDIEGRTLEILTAVARYEGHTIKDVVNEVLGEYAYECEIGMHDDGYEPA